jgi:aminopeptidase YwaD
LVNNAGQLTVSSTPLKKPPNLSRRYKTMTTDIQSPTTDTNPQLWADFNRICDFGGRLAGSESEHSARHGLMEMGEAATGVACQLLDVSYQGWRAKRCELRLADGTLVPSHPLVRSGATGPEGLAVEVVDLGRGTPEEFAAHAAEIPGRIVLVRHELMFAAGTIHRGKKFQAALDHGASGFLVAGPVSGQVVAGSSGRPETAAIPAAGITPETAEMLRQRVGGLPSVHLLIEIVQGPQTSQNLVFDIPGQEDEWVVLSAHLDGHDLAESAIDNATGLAVALSVARDIGPTVGSRRRGLRLAFFNVEEWTLTGSAHYVDRLTMKERARIALNINVDSVAGDSWLTALTSGFARLEPFLLQQAEQAGVPLRLFRPLQINSDHANFAHAAIPAFRLVAGFNDPAAATRFVLTPEDSRDKVTITELGGGVSRKGYRKQGARRVTGGSCGMA